MPKWAALGAVADKSLADVDPDTIDNIYDEAELGVPPKGPYLFNLKRLQGTESKAGDPMLKMVLELAEPKGTKKAKYNGYSIWYYQVSTKERASGVNGLLHALLDGKTPAQRKKVVESYWAGNVVVDDDGFVKKIGTWTVPESILIGANPRHENDAQYGERLAVAFNGIMPASDRPASKVADEDEDADEPDEDEVDEDETEEGDEDADARAEELDGLGLAALRKIAKELEVATAGLKKDALIDAILDAEFGEGDEDADEEEPEEDEEDAEEEDEDEEPEGDEFDEMDRAALKKFNTTEKLGIKVTTKMTDDDLRDAIRAALPEDEEEPDEEEAEEEEPEPTPAPRRGRAKATAAAPGRAAARRRKGSDDEPPF